MRSTFKHKRRGTTAVELMVAATLLVSMISLLGPLTVRTSRVWNDGRQLRVALDELCNQLDLLTSLDREQLTQALEQLTPSEEAKKVLSDAKLSHRMLKDDDGERLILSLEWDRPVKATPVSLVGWVDPLPQEDSTATHEPEDLQENSL